MLFNAVACNVVGGLINYSNRLAPVSVSLSSVIGNQQIIVGVKPQSINVISSISEVQLQTGGSVVISNIKVSPTFSQINLIYHGSITVNSISVLTHTSQIQTITSVLLHLVKNLTSDIIISDIAMSYGLHTRNIQIDTEILKPFLRAWGFIKPASQWDIEEISNDWIIKY